MYRARGAVAFGVAVLFLGPAGCRAQAAQARPLTPTSSSSTSAAPVRTTTSADAGPQPEGMPGTWRLVFDDEFNGDSLDTARWSTGWLATGITPDVSNLGIDCDDPRQVAVSGGALRLTLVRETEQCGGTTQRYATGAVNSDGKASFLFGAFEARIYLPPTPSYVANWPAWWTDGQHWPADGEMDIMEGLFGRACYHLRYSATGASGSCAGNAYNGWHTYAADWEPGSVTYYYDGVQVGQITDSGIDPAPQFLVLNYSAEQGSGFTVAPATMQVDYVRVWQH